ncbi:hypothetical protein BYT27DRAFT_7251267 [Phlegmacium glaucopus]|nr:hypothetical protein BYT27DRAFT_7251267 [Phlegmacium glaucopus]
MLSAPHNNQLSRRNAIVWVPTRPRNSGEVRRTFPPPAPASTSAASTSTALTSAVPISTPATAEIYRQGQCQGVKMSMTTTRIFTKYHLDLRPISGIEGGDHQQLPTYFWDDNDGHGRRRHNDDEHRHTPSQTNEDNDSTNNNEQMRTRNDDEERTNTNNDERTNDKR